MTFLAQFPNVTANSIDDAIEQLSPIRFEDTLTDLSSLQVRQDGVVSFNGREVQMTNMGHEPFASLFRYPKKNFEILSGDRLADDLNFLIQNRAAEDVVRVRHSNGLLYDVQKVNPNKLKGVTQSPSTLLSRLKEVVPPSVDYSGKIVYADGRLRCSLRRVESDLIVGESDLNSTGVFMDVSDHGRHWASTSFNVYRTSCENSATGIASKKVLFHRDADRFGQLVKYASWLFNNTEGLTIVYRRLKDIPLSPFTVEKMRYRLASKIGNKSAMKILAPYFTEKLVSEVFASGSKYSVEHVVNEESLTNSTEFDLMNEITGWSKNEEDFEIQCRINEVGGSLIADQLALV